MGQKNSTSVTLGLACFSTTAFHNYSIIREPQKMTVTGDSSELDNLMPRNDDYNYHETTCEKLCSTRFKIALLGFLGFATLFSMRVIMSIAIVEMVYDQGTKDGSYDENCPVSETSRGSVSIFTSNKLSRIGHVTRMRSLMYNQKFDGNFVAARDVNPEF